MPPTVTALPKPRWTRPWGGRVQRRHCALGLLCGLIALIGVGSRPAVAQPVVQPRAPCDSLLAAAERHYVNQDFDRAEPLTTECLARRDVTDAAAIAAHRLRALIYLRQDDLEDAKQAVIRLLGVSFDYEPDPVQDLPAYVALVHSIKEQLRVEAEDRVEAGDGVEARPEPLPPSLEDGLLATSSRGPARRRPGTLSLRMALGAGSYGGERGVDESSPFREFTSNGGVSFELGASYRLPFETSVALTYRAVRFSRLLDNDVRAEDVQVRPDDSSAWVHLLTLLGQRTFGRDWRVAPFVHLGVTSSLSRFNDEVRLGIGPVLGVGADVALTPDLGAFAALSTTIVYPGDAVDRVDTSSTSGDVLTFIGAGLRYRVYGPPRRPYR